MSIYKVQVPALGHGISEAKIFQWLKKPKDFVDYEEPLFELSTEKVDIEIPSPCCGYLQKIVAESGTIVQANQVVAYVSADKNVDLIDTKVKKNNDNDNKNKDLDLDQTVQKKMAIINDKKSNKHITYAVNNWQKPEMFTKNRSYNFINPISIKKKKKNNNDNNNKIDNQESKNHQDKDSVYHHELDDNNINFSSTLSTKTAAYVNNNYYVFNNYSNEKHQVNLTNARIVLNDKLVYSYMNIPQLTSFITVDFSKVIAHRKKYKSKNHQISFNAYLLKALSHVLTIFAKFNSYLDNDDKIIYHKKINIASAVAQNDLIYAPVVHNVNSFDLIALSVKWQELVKKCRDKSISIDELSNPSFTISNPGMYGAIRSNALVLKNQSAIINIGSIQPTWLACLRSDHVRSDHGDDRDKITAQSSDIVWQKKQLAEIGLSFDHRLIDGKDAGLFLSEFKRYIENFS